MPVTDTPRRAGPFYGDGAATIFPFKFRVFAGTDLLVTRATDGIAETLTLGPDYSVTLNSDQANSPGGNIVLHTALQVGSTLASVGNLAYRQPAALPQGGNFNSVVIQDALDRMVMLLQQQSEITARTFRAPPGEQFTDLPTASTRANNLLGFDGSGNVIPTLPIAGSATQVTLDLANGGAPGKGAFMVFYQPLSLDANMTQRTVYSKLIDYPDTHDASADSTGATSAVSGLQKALNKAWDTMFFASPWAGVGPAHPIVMVNPGRYRMTDGVTMSNGTTLKGMGRPVNTTSHTRWIMDSTATVPGGGGGDNRNKAMLRFTRATRNGAALANSAATWTIQDMEFWFVTLGNVFDTPLSGAGIPFAYRPDRSANPAGYPLGATLLIDVDCVDARIVGCCFQHSPAALHGRNVGSTTAMRPDGFNGSYGINLYVIDSEFDAGANILFENCNLDLHFKGVQFYGCTILFKNCTGTVTFDAACRFYGGTFIDAGDVANHFDLFAVHGTDFDQHPARPSVWVRNAKQVEVKLAAFTGATVSTTILLEDCDGGTVDCGSIRRSGENGPVGTDITDFTAAVKLLGCWDMIVTKNPISFDRGSPAVYNGFGILTGPSSLRTVGGAEYGRNFVEGNTVTAPYNGATYRRQDRAINLDPADIRGPNQNSHNLTYPGTFSGGLYVDGAALVDKVLLASVSSNDLATLLPDTGLYLVIIQTQYQSNLANMNVAAYLCWRGTGATNVQQLALSNTAPISGLISLNTTTVSTNYTAGTPYYLTITANRLAKNGKE